MEKIATINYLKYEISDTGSGKEAYVISYDHRKKFGKVHIPKSIVVDGEVIHVAGLHFNCFDYLRGNRVEVPNTLKINGVDLTELAGYTEEQNGVTFYIYEARESQQLSIATMMTNLIKTIMCFFSKFHKKTHILHYATADCKQISIKPDTFDAPIASHTFKRGVGKIVFDQPLTKIADNAFYKVDNLSNIAFPEGLVEIGEKAFYDCKNLLSITIPTSLTKIGNSAFGGWDTNLRAIHISDLKAWCKIKFKGLDSLYKSYTELYLNGKLITDLVIPEGIESLSHCLFYGYKKLTSVTLPNSFKAFPNNFFLFNSLPFERCSALKAYYGKYSSPDNRCVVMEGSLRCVASAGLTEYKIPNGVTKIAAKAFAWASSLERVTIPESITNINNDAFIFCDRLKHFDGKFASDDNRSLVIDGELICVALAGLKEYKIPEGVKSIRDANINTSDILEKVMIPNTVTIIGEYAFNRCKKLKSISMPDSITAISWRAFHECCELEEIIIPHSVNSLGDEAFYECKKLKNVYLKPLTPPKCGKDVFRYNASGRKIYVPKESVDLYKSEENLSQYAQYIEPYDFE